MDILIAEKNVSLGELVGYQCAALNFETRLVADGREALMELRTKKFKLLITDLLLPFYTGLEVIQYINQAGWLETPKMIIITQITNEQTVQKAFNLGIDDYITRPLDMDFLMHRITKLLHYD
jgi:DNA-binding response OmpR family regulator